METSTNPETGAVSYCVRSQQFSLTLLRTGDGKAYVYGAPMRHPSGYVEPPDAWLIGYLYPINLTASVEVTIAAGGSTAEINTFVRCEWPARYSEDFGWHWDDYVVGDLEVVDGETQVLKIPLQPPLDSPEDLIRAHEPEIDQAILRSLATLKVTGPLSWFGHRRKKRKAFRAAFSELLPLVKKMIAAGKLSSCMSGGKINYEFSYPGPDPSESVVDCESYYCIEDGSVVVSLELHRHTMSGRWYLMMDVELIVCGHKAERSIQEYLESVDKLLLSDPRQLSQTTLKEAICSESADLLRMTLVGIGESEYFAWPTDCACDGNELFEGAVYDLHSTLSDLLGGENP